MKKTYGGNANKSGIYKIINHSNGRFYIGSCKRFKQRASEHHGDLRTNRHSNKFLQNDWNKCDENCFEFIVVEVLEKSEEERRAKEQTLLDQSYDNQKNCYNIAKTTEAIPRRVFSNDPDITKKVLSEKSKAMWKNPATRKKILKRKNEAMKTSEYKKALKEGLERAWDDNERREKTSKRLKEEHASGSREQFVEVLKENQKKGRKTFKERMKADTEFKKKYQEHGKTKVAKIQERYKKDANFRKKMDAHSRKNITDYNESRELTKKPTFVGPNGKVYDNIYNLAEFARNNGLDLSCAYKLVNGKLKKHRGWKLFTS